MLRNSLRSLKIVDVHGSRNLSSITRTSSGMASPALVGGIASLMPRPFACTGRRYFRGSNFQLAKKGFFYEIGLIFSKERREARAKALQEEVTRGRFYELNELKATGGKLFDGDDKVIPANMAIPFPNITGVNLAGTTTSTDALLRGKVSLLTFCVRDIARPMIVSWTKPFEAKFPKDQHIQVLDVCFVEGSVYRMLQSIMLSSMKQRIPEASWTSTFVSFSSSEAVRKELSMTNRLVGYVFLIDQEGRIRWKGVGYAQPHELKALTDAVPHLTRLRNSRT